MKLSNANDILDARIGAFNYRHLRRLDWGLLLLVLALAAAGIVTLISASRSYSDGMPYYVKQMIFFTGFGGIALFIACLDHRFLVSMAPLAYAILVSLLVAVLFVGTEVKGGQRWLDLGAFRIQPSEQSKLALIFMLAWYFNLIGRRVRSIFFFALTFVIAAVPALLILKQPNLGTAAALGPITIAMLYAAGCKRWHLAAVFVSGLIAAPVAWSQLKDYQKTRVLTFLDPAADPKGSGWHTIQSIITVGSGGPTGKGYFQGTQSYLKYLPEHHTDFIFSLLAEEWGFVGAITVIGLFSVLFLRCLSLARECPDYSGALLAVGVMTLLAFHVFVNIAITIGLMPVTGIPLPFLSYGGNFYLTTMMCIGVLLSVNVRKHLA